MDSKQRIGATRLHWRRTISDGGHNYNAEPHAVGGRHILHSAIEPNGHPKQPGQEARKLQTKEVISVIMKEGRTSKAGLSGASFASGTQRRALLRPRSAYWSGSRACARLSEEPALPLLASSLRISLSLQIIPTFAFIDGHTVAFFTIYLSNNNKETSYSNEQGD